MRLGIIRLYIGDSGKFGYYNMQELGLAKALVENGDFEVYIFLLRNKKIYPEQEIIEISDKIKFVYLPAISIGTHGLINPGFIKRYEIDVVHLSSDIQLNTGRIIKWCLKNKVPVYSCIGTIESDSNIKIKKYLSNVLFSLNKVFLNKVTNIAKTPYVYSKLKEKGIKNVKLIPVGLDIKELNNNSNIDKQILRKKYNIPSDTKLLLFVGKLEEYKKPLMAIEVLKNILKIDDGYSLLMVGSGLLKQRIFHEISISNLNSKFYYIEKISNKDIWEIYKLSDVFINMNDAEIYGMSILEAMYYKCPIIAVKAPGPKFIIDDNETGYIIEDYDMQKWILAIKKAIKNRKEIGDKANKKITQELNWDVISIQYIELYQELINSYQHYRLREIT
ncbi:glycosyltransferase family 4 protein [Thermoanaerobacterium sp. RBIITD]|uniref:glycosyltransferase family 4 protein n=1 Tax=Thermoanaerobacterium sp. RBIITD TaxID=1550240 RepID=UPI000BB934E4|nr:glycosyltransferase family 4 protein [Thermoanaerobacterium sp. RBIITD]SNX52924.1 1,2-diacylglycerol 3-alpha-glucosyltransferase [Thermoanaerobacterium sp. RBIITD]